MILDKKTRINECWVIIFIKMGQYWVSIFISLGHYLGHYNDLAKVIIIFLGCGYPDYAHILWHVNDHL